ncbi:transcriptional repressor TraM [Aminobacter aminovorans]
MSSGSDDARQEHKPPMRPVVGLTEGLTKKDLEQLTIEAIRAHRVLRDEAEALHPPYVEDQSATCDTVGSARLAWISAMLKMHAHQAALSTLLDLLGYIPDVPEDRKTPRSIRSA